MGGTLVITGALSVIKITVNFQAPFEGIFYRKCRGTSQGMLTVESVEMVSLGCELMNFCHTYIEKLAPLELKRGPKLGALTQSRDFTLDAQYLFSAYRF